MATLREGDYLKCDVCDLVVIVDEECGCIEGGLICCEEEMIKVKGPAKAKKAKAKPAVKAKKATAKRTVKKKAKAKKK